MERMYLTGAAHADAVGKSANVLKRGGVILFPTDTLYGLGADAFSDQAVDAVYAIKGRDEKKPIHCIVADLAMAEEYAEVGNDARLLAKRFLPGGLTLILKKKAAAHGGIARNIGTIGIRMPKHDFCLALARRFGMPYTATSANRSGARALPTIDEIIEQLGPRAAGIDLSLDACRPLASEPSTVVDLSRGEPAILREGTVPAAEVWETMRAEE